MTEEQGRSEQESTEAQLRADRFDVELDALLTGRGAPSDRLSSWLAATTRTDPPPELRARIEATVGGAARPDRPSRRLQLVALAMCTAFLFQGVGNLVSAPWIARGIGEPLSRHAYTEGGFALIALALCALLAAVRRSWSGVSALVCTPLAVSLGVHGLGEIGTFAPGVALHLTEGACGLALAAIWWLDGRDAARRSREEGS